MEDKLRLTDVEVLERFSILQAFMRFNVDVCRYLQYSDIFNILLLFIDIFNIC